MKANKIIKEVMTKELTTIEVDKSLQEANDVILNNKFRHLPVVDNGKLKGILSLTDLQRMSFTKEFGDSQIDADKAVFEMLKIEQVMKHDPQVVNENDTVGKAAAIFIEEEFHALPVINSKGELSGIVTSSDIIKCLL